MSNYFFLLLFLCFTTTISISKQIITIETYTHLPTTLMAKLPTYHNKRPVIFRHAMQDNQVIKLHQTIHQAEPQSIRLGSSKHWSKQLSQGISLPKGTTITTKDLLAAVFNRQQDITAILPVSTNSTLPPLIEEIFKQMHNLTTMEISNEEFVSDPKPFDQHDESFEENNPNIIKTNTNNNEISRNILISNRNAGIHFHRETSSFTYHSAGNTIQWFLYPPSTLIPLEHASRTSIHDWYNNRIYPILEHAERPYECTTQPGDILHIPEGWHQAFLVTPRRRSRRRRRQRGDNDAAFNSDSDSDFDSDLDFDNDFDFDPQTTSDTDSDSDSTTYLARSQWNRPTSKTEIIRNNAMQAKAFKDYSLAIEYYDDLYFYTNEQDYETMYQIGVLLGLRKDTGDISRELQIKKQVMLLMNNRSCDVLHSFGRTMLRVENYLQARTLSRKCVGVCDRFSKCYELLSRSIEGLMEKETYVSQQALEMSKEYRKQKKKTIEFVNGLVLEVP